jgi:hypothetical protein
MLQLKQQPPAAITGGGIIKDAAQSRSGRMAMGVMIPASAAALYQSAGISFSKYHKVVCTAGPAPAAMLHP